MSDWTEIDLYRYGMLVYLLHKLYNYAVRGVVHDWSRNYLTNRQQFTWIAKMQSSVTCVSCGVSQGSVLGPLLFLIYINDIGNAVANDNITDDTNLFIFGNNIP